MQVPHRLALADHLEAFTDLAAQSVDFAGDLMTLEGSAEPLLATEFMERNGAISPEVEESAPTLSVGLQTDEGVVLGTPTPVARQVRKGE